MFTLKDLMSRNVQWASPEDALRDVAKKMDVLNVSDLPVCEEGRLVGILSRSRVVSLGRTQDPKSSPLKAREAMLSEVTFGAATLDVKTAIRIMREKKLRTMPVVDEGHRLIGIFQMGL
ncbi:MAG TPA: CBS domain-containing protein [Planctomycetota bacterium]|nr:CBS domain-containing protein [Planctomycetota bacterium]